MRLREARVGPYCRTGPEHADAEPECWVGLSQNTRAQSDFEREYPRHNATSNTLIVIKPVITRLPSVGFGESGVPHRDAQRPSRLAVASLFFPLLSFAVIFANVGLRRKLPV